MNTTTRTTVLLAVSLICITGQAASADVFVSELPGLVTTYVPGMEPITTSIDYRGGTGGISSINSIRVEFTGTGVPGIDPFNNELPIEIVVSVPGHINPVVFGPFDQTPIDFELFELWGHLDFGWSQSSNIVSVVVEPRIADGSIVNSPFVSLSAATITVDFSDCGADIGCDGFVGIAELNVVLGNWNLNVPPADPLADNSGDSFIGIDDLNFVLGNWNAGTPPGVGDACFPEDPSCGGGFFGIVELNRVLANWNQSSPPADPQADWSGDGYIGIDDLNWVLSRWNAGTPPAANAVPEPGALALLGMLGLLPLRRLR